MIALTIGGMAALTGCGRPTLSPADPAYNDPPPAMFFPGQFGPGITTGTGWTGFFPGYATISSGLLGGVAATGFGSAGFTNSYGTGTTGGFVGTGG